MSIGRYEVKLSEKIARLKPVERQQCIARRSASPASRLSVSNTLPGRGSRQPRLRLLLIQESAPFHCTAMREPVPAGGHVAAPAWLKELYRLLRLWPKDAGRPSKGPSHATDELLTRYPQDVTSAARVQRIEMRVRKQLQSIAMVLAST